MKDLAIYGAGGFGREMALLVQQINQVRDTWNLVGFYDDGVVPGKLVDSLPVLGGLQNVNKETGPLDLVIAIADPAIRRSLVQQIVNHNIHYPILIHPNAVLGATSNRIGRGTIVQAGSIMTTGISIGDFGIIQGAVTVGHDADIENFVSIMPGSSVSGNVKIGEGTLIGTGARLLQNLSIGRNCVVGAGAVVLESVESGVTVVGIPAKRIQS